MKSFPVVLSLAACLGAAACAKTTARPRGNPIPAPATMQVPGTSGQSMLSPDGQFTRKEVVAKEAPATLVAADRSRCMVPADRFQSANVGSREICDWRAGGRAP